jgi:hypothetical protein
LISFGTPTSMMVILMLPSRRTRLTRAYSNRGDQGMATRATAG